MTVKDRLFQEVLGEKYLSYALSTIVSRSLPDLRDGLKPVHRRLLFAMRELKLRPESGFKKCARVVGDVIGKFHPHGDVAVYETLVRLSQDFSLRYPLIEGQGNFGNIDGDNAAAMRYTEARLTDIAMLLFEGMDENAISFKKTYDAEAEEPEVLPAGFPNLLANGASGIAVGMATNIPSHNILELCKAMQLLLKKPETTTSELMSVFHGPDFPTGGRMLITPKQLEDIYTKGTGTIRIRAKYSVEELSRGKYIIVVTEIPYGVPKGRLLEKMGELIDSKKLSMLSDLRDESTEDIRIILEPKSSTLAADDIMELLYKETDLEVRFGVNLNVITKHQTPKVMGIKDLLQSYLDHRLEVLLRCTQFRIQKIEDRLNLVKGFLIVYLNLDRVIEIIRTHDEPKEQMMVEFGLNDVQAEAILNMKLRSLRKLEEMELKKEAADLERALVENKALLANSDQQKATLLSEVEALHKKFQKDPRGARKTEVVSEFQESSINLQHFVEKEAITVVCSAKGWIKTIKGIVTNESDIKFKDGDQAEYVLPGETTDKLVIVSSYGKSYTLSCDKLPGGRGFGDPLRLMIDLAPDETIISMFLHKPESEKKLYLLVSSDGRGFCIEEESFLSQTKNGKQALVLAENVFAFKCLPIAGDSVAVVGQNRKMLIFSVSELPLMQRGRGVTLQKYLQGAISDIKVFNFESGLSFGSKIEKQLERWKVKRGHGGRLAPNGFPKNNKFD